MSTTLQAQTAVTVWSIDPVHSSVQFKVRHLTISNVRGEFKSIHGTLNLDADDITKSSIDATIDVTSINTREEHRDGHLKSADFLDAEQYPVMHFRSTHIDKVKAGSFSVSGELAIHGVSRQIVLNVSGPSPIMTDPSRFPDGRLHLHTH